MSEKTVYYLVIPSSSTSSNFGHMYWSGQPKMMSWDRDKSTGKQFSNISQLLQEWATANQKLPDGGIRTDGLSILEEKVVTKVVTTEEVQSERLLG